MLHTFLLAAAAGGLMSAALAAVTLLALERFDAPLRRFAMAAVVGGLKFFIAAVTAGLMFAAFSAVTQIMRP